MANPTKFSWTDPTTNTDGTPIQAGEISGYLLGIRSLTAAGSAAGVYPITVTVPGATAANELISSLGQVLVPGTYAAAVQAIGPVDSAYSSEATFTITAPVPSAPTNFSVS